MVIEKLNLCNYRNYETLDLNVDSKTNILYGDNAQGKTNILEAIYIYVAQRNLTEVGKIKKL